ncbi:anti-phage dCTP deaminase [Marinobacter sp. ATCH36]|uniref:anti-phage dCTP deaminase n=1 Tax=Marinobacter sp. ATCH36 TaxID=2945106 RepID=UPI00201FE499|nr:anti-phage dCTP deaminase [Marinobacter sp. ATCH36]MCL7942961.1 deaminase [Marinobacter sp. ATCH36]
MASEAVQILHQEDKKKTRATPKNPVSVVRSRQAKELVIGLCGAIGSGVLQVKNSLIQELENAGYIVFHIRLSKFIADHYEDEYEGIKSLSGAERYKKLQTLGNNMRDHYGSEILAELSIREIATTRSYNASDYNEDNPKFAFLIDQLKNPAEVEVFRLVYPGIFYLLGVLSPEESRKSSLELEGLKPHEINKLVERDRKDETNSGQQLEKTLKEADYFLSNPNGNLSHLKHSIQRFVGLIHGENGLTPTNDEYGMYAAYAASLGSACLSRQVGASIVDSAGHILATGCNDVPKFGGGRYTADDGNQDHRCVWNRGFCRNDYYKAQLIETIGVSVNTILDSLDEKAKEHLPGDLKDRIYQAVAENSQLKSIIEYSRAVHAEMDAIVALSREGKTGSIGATLFSTTYPCHSCARHIISAGIEKVVFIEPYEKSLAKQLHNDAITVGSDEGKVTFVSFEGVAPRRFDTFFGGQKRRKDSDGIATRIILSDANPVDAQFLDTYKTYEEKILASVTAKLDDEATYVPGE